MRWLGKDSSSLRAQQLVEPLRIQYVPLPGTLLEYTAPVLVSAICMSG
jgi:hypothetical protein